MGQGRGEGLAATVQRVFLTSSPLPSKNLPLPSMAALRQIDRASIPAHAHTRIRRPTERTCERAQAVGREVDEPARLCLEQAPQRRSHAAPEPASTPHARNTPPVWPPVEGPGRRKPARGGWRASQRRRGYMGQEGPLVEAGGSMLGGCCDGSSCGSPVEFDTTAGTRGRGEAARKWAGSPAPTCAARPRKPTACTPCLSPPRPCRNPSGTHPGPSGAPGGRGSER